MDELEHKLIDVVAIMPDLLDGGSGEDTAEWSGVDGLIFGCAVVIRIEEEEEFLLEGLVIWEVIF